MPESFPNPNRNLENGSSQLELNSIEDVVQFLIRLGVTFDSEKTSFDLQALPDILVSEVVQKKFLDAISNLVKSKQAQVVTTIQDTDNELHTVSSGDINDKIFNLIHRLRDVTSCQLRLLGDSVPQDYQHQSILDEKYASDFDFAPVNPASTAEISGGNIEYLDPEDVTLNVRYRGVVSITRIPDESDKGFYYASTSEVSRDYGTYGENNKADIPESLNSGLSQTPISGQGDPDHPSFIAVSNDLNGGRVLTTTSMVILRDNTGDRSNSFHKKVDLSVGDSYDPREVLAANITQIAQPFNFDNYNTPKREIELDLKKPKRFELSDNANLILQSINSSTDLPYISPFDRPISEQEAIILAQLIKEKLNLDYDGVAYNCVPEKLCRLVLVACLRKEDQDKVTAFRVKIAQEYSLSVYNEFDYVSLVKLLSTSMETMSSYEVDFFRQKIAEAKSDDRILQTFLKVLQNERRIEKGLLSRINLQKTRDSRPAYIVRFLLLLNSGFNDPIIGASTANYYRSLFLNRDNTTIRDDVLPYLGLFNIVETSVIQFLNGKYRLRDWGGAIQPAPPTPNPAQSEILPATPTSIQPAVAQRPLVFPPPAISVKRAVKHRERGLQDRPLTPPLVIPPQDTPPSKEKSDHTFNELVQLLTKKGLLTVVDGVYKISNANGLIADQDSFRMLISLMQSKMITLKVNYFFLGENTTESLETENLKEAIQEYFGTGFQSLEIEDISQKPVHYVQLPKPPKPKFLDRLKTRLNGLQNKGEALDYEYVPDKRFSSLLDVQEVETPLQWLSSLDNPTLSSILAYEEEYRYVDALKEIVHIAEEHLFKHVEFSEIEAYGPAAIAFINQTENLSSSQIQTFYYTVFQILKKFDQLEESFGKIYQPIPQDTRYVPFSNAVQSIMYRVDTVPQFIEVIQELLVYSKGGLTFDQINEAILKANPRKEGQEILLEVFLNNGILPPFRELERIWNSYTISNGSDVQIDPTSLQDGNPLFDYYRSKPEQNPMRGVEMTTHQITQYQSQLHEEIRFGETPADSLLHEIESLWKENLNYVKPLRIDLLTKFDPIIHIIIDSFDTKEEVVEFLQAPYDPNNAVCQKLSLKGCNRTRIERAIISFNGSKTPRIFSLNFRLLKREVRKLLEIQSRNHLINEKSKELVNKAASNPIFGIDKEGAEVVMRQYEHRMKTAQFVLVSLPKLQKGIGFSGFMNTNFQGMSLGQIVDDPNVYHKINRQLALDFENQKNNLITQIDALTNILRMDIPPIFQDVGFMRYEMIDTPVFIAFIDEVQAWIDLPDVELANLIHNFGLKGGLISDHERFISEIKNIEEFKDQLRAFITNVNQNMVESTRSYVTYRTALLHIKPLLQKIGDKINSFQSDQFYTDAYRDQLAESVFGLSDQMVAFGFDKNLVDSRLKRKSFEPTPDEQNSQLVTF